MGDKKNVLRAIMVRNQKNLENEKYGVKKISRKIFVKTNYGVKKY